jgi:hypothetical protein
VRCKSGGVNAASTTKDEWQTIRVGRVTPCVLSAPASAPFNESPASISHGWSHPEDDDNKGGCFMTILEIPPLTSPKMVVKMAINSDIKSQRK